ncbi:hypothetical protein ES702_02431 [subsurface metagenome]
MRTDEIDEEILLALRDSTKKLKEIGSLVKSQRIAKRRIEKLLRYGLIKRIRQGVYALSSKGKNYIKRFTPTIAVTLNDPKLEALIDKIPTESHKAIFRLSLSGITAKLLLFKYFDNNWPASIMVGSTKAFKTGMLDVLCKIIKGLDSKRNVYSLFRGSPGEFGIRRFKKKGGFDVSESYLFSELLAGIDELDKASKELKTMALSFADGRREFIVEGKKKVVNHAYAFIIANTSAKGLEIPDYVIRRSVVINTDSLKDELGDVDLSARDIFTFLRSPKAPKIDLTKLPVVETRLSEENFLFMRNLFMKNVRKDYENLVDTAPLEIFTLGRLSLLGRKDIKEVIFQTVWDRLECLETMKGAKEGWRKYVGDSWLQYRSIEQPQVLARIKEAEERERKRKEKIEKTKEEVIREKIKKKQEDLLFIEERATLIARLRELRDKLPGEKKWQNKCFPLKEQIKSLIERIKGIRNSQDLEVYQRVLPKIENEQKTLIEEIAQDIGKEEKLSKEEEERQNAIKRKKIVVKEEYKDLKKLLNAYFRKTGGMSDQNRRFLESIFSDIQMAQNIDTLNSIKSRIQENKEKIQGWISKLKEEKKEQKAKEEKEKEKKQKEQEQNKKIRAIAKKKREILEKRQKDVFESKYLTSKQRVELDILQKYQKRKKLLKNITLFLEGKGLIAKVNWFTCLSNEQTVFSLFRDSYFKRFGEFLPSEVYWAVDGQVYPLNYFNTWDRALLLIQIKIDQIKNIAIQNRKDKLMEEWNRLDKEEQILKKKSLLSFAEDLREEIKQISEMGERSR